MAQRTPEYTQALWQSYCKTVTGTVEDALKVVSNIDCVFGPRPPEMDNQQALRIGNRVFAVARDRFLEDIRDYGRTFVRDPVDAIVQLGMVPEEVADPRAALVAHLKNVEHAEKSARRDTIIGLRLLAYQTARATIYYTPEEIDERKKDKPPAARMRDDYIDVKIYDFYNAAAQILKALGKWKSPAIVEDEFAAWRAVYEVGKCNTYVGGLRDKYFEMCRKENLVPLLVGQTETKPNVPDAVRRVLAPDAPPVA